MSASKRAPGLAAVFLSHYRRSPLQLLGLVLIVTIAMMLWTGVSTLTDLARESLQRSQAALEPETTIQRSDSEAVTQADFAALRRAGLCVSPRLMITIAVEPAIKMIGIDPYTLGCIQEVGVASGYSALATGLGPRLQGNPATLARWPEIVDPTDVGSPAPILIPDAKLPDGILVGDIAVVAAYRQLGTSNLELLAPPTLTQPLPPAYRVEIRSFGVTSEELAESFLLNLDALGILALLVAALLIRSVYVFGLSQRQLTLTLLHQAGIRPATIAFCLAVELLLIATAGAIVGMLLGTEVARLFSAGIQATLSGLFSVATTGFIYPGLDDWLSSGAILLLITFWACSDQFWRYGRTVRTGSRRFGHAQHLVLAALLALAGFVLLWLSNNLWQVYGGLAMALGGLALSLPHLLTLGLGWCQRRTRNVLTEWSLSEMRALADAMTLPLIALAFAIAATIGVYTMVTSFEATFQRWLDQRLQGDIFLEMSNPDSPWDSRWDSQQIDQAIRRLQHLESVSRVHPVLRSAALADGQAVDAVAVNPLSPLLQSWEFLQALPEPWARLNRGDGVMINEQLSRRRGLSAGDAFELVLDNGATDVTVLAVYPDYGRPTGEVLMNLEGLGRQLRQGSLSFVLTLAAGTDIAPEQMLESAGIPFLQDYRNQKSIKDLAEDAFSRTFAITQALSSLTLLLSGIAMALIGYVSFRLRQPLYSLVHVFGLSGQQVRRRLVAHATALALMLAVLAVPLGILMSWVLVARINPIAFGWALPFDLYPGFWALIVSVSAVLGAAVGLVMGNPVKPGFSRAGVAILPILMLLAGCDFQKPYAPDTGFAGLGADSGGFSQPHPGRLISLPDDMGAHPNFRLEWWYLTANLKSADGRRFGVQWTLFRQSLVPGVAFTPANAWDSNEVWMAHAALSTPDTHHFAEKFARGDVGQAGVRTAPFRAWLDDWALVGEDPQYQVAATADDFGYHLTLTRTGETVRHGDNGFSAKSPDGQGSMYFSFANLVVRGEIRLNGEIVEVEGQGWFDREWSSQLLRSSQEGWDWFSIHLENGAKLMVFQLRGDTPYFAGTYVSKAGSVVPLASSEISLESLGTRKIGPDKIPVNWRLQVPRLQIDLQVESWPGDYRNLGAFPYWEGPVDITGSHQGEGYLEMTGYLKP